jgi:hypothetical protein
LFWSRIVVTPEQRGPHAGREFRQVLELAPSTAFLWGFNFLHPMLYEQGLGKFRTGVIVSRQMNPKSG